MSHTSATRPTRRGILAAGGALGLGAVLAACGDDDGGSGGSGGGPRGANYRPSSIKQHPGPKLYLSLL